LTPAAWQLTNYYLEMTATTDTCSGRDRYGFVIATNYPADNPSYLYRFSCDGYYSFGYFDSNVDNKFHSLKDWTQSSYLMAGSNQTNRMGFWASGHDIKFYANGYFLSDLNVPDFGTGRFGLFIGSVHTENFTVRLSQVQYWLLP
jgi:hypothetical protein